MTKFKVIGDSTSKPRFSTHVIVSSLNEAAKRVGLYTEDGRIVKYDCICNDHGDKLDAFIAPYELSFPDLIVSAAAGRPILGVSHHNLEVIRQGGVSEDKSGKFGLGVDTNLWPLLSKTNDNSRFCVGVYTESLVRGGIELCIDAFKLAFGDDKDCVLKIKDRNATPHFENYVKNEKKYTNIEYINEHWSEAAQAQNWFSGLDYHLYLNRCSQPFSCRSIETK